VGPRGGNDRGRKEKGLRKKQQKNRQNRGRRVKLKAGGQFFRLPIAGPNNRGGNPFLTDGSTQQPRDSRGERNDCSGGSRVEGGGGILVLKVRERKSLTFAHTPASGKVEHKKWLNKMDPRRTKNNRRG